MRTLAEYYNGSKWAIEPTPNPLSAGNDYIVSVAIDKSGTLWAVGQTVPDNLDPPTSLILKYTHGKWVNVPVSFHIVLEGVTVAGSTLYAVGQTGIRSLAEHYADGEWKVLKSAN